MSEAANIVTIEKRSPSNPPAFQDVPVGGMFRAQYPSGDVYMRVAYSLCLPLSSALNLRTGMLCEFASTTPVERLMPLDIVHIRRPGMS